MGIGCVGVDVCMYGWIVTMWSHGYNTFLLRIRCTMCIMQIRNYVMCDVSKGI